VPVCSFESAEGLDFLTMAFIAGRPLDELIPAGGFETAKLLEIAVPLADALRAAHQQGIVHRDLKPANVMLDRDGRPRVLDFGLAKRETTLGANLGQGSTLGPSELMTRAGIILGTFPYMSPEQAEGKPVDARSDLFSFGVMLYEMACGQRPFRGDTAISLISSILRDLQRPARETKPALPARLDATLARCLEKDPNQRYASAADLKMDLEALRQEIAHGRAQLPEVSWPTTVLPAEPAPYLFLRVRRRGAIWLAAAVALAAMGVVATRNRRSDLTALPPTDLAATPANPSIAVLPFADLSPTGDQEYLADGIAEELIDRLGRVSRLRVAARTSAFSFEGRNVDVSEIGRRLGVAYLLEGSVRPASERLRINVRLIRAADSMLLWSGRWERPPEEVLAVQDLIAADVLQVLEVAIPPSAQGQSQVDPRAYALFLQSRHAARQQTPESFDEKSQLLRRAVAIDRRFVAAWAQLARYYAGDASLGLRPF
jgi:serine/threonine-protein kinase